MNNRTFLTGEVNEVIRKIEKKQRRSLLLTLVGILLACVIAAVVVFVSYTLVKDNLKDLDKIIALKKQAENEAKKARIDAAKAKEELENMKVRLIEEENAAKKARQEQEVLFSQIKVLDSELKEAKESLRKATDFAQYRYTSNWAVTMKSLYGNARFRRQSELLDYILDLQNRGVGWKLGGFSPEEGFDSPSFIAYVLEQKGLLRGYNARDVRYRLQEIMTRANSPEIGDVVFYASGYSMFYFKDEGGRPFVIGMTPLGIFALRENFVSVFGYARVDYSH